MAGVVQKPLRVLYSFPDKLDLSGDSLDYIAWQQIAGVASHGVDPVVYCTSIVTALPRAIAARQTLAIVGRRVPHRVLGLARSRAFHDWQVARALGKLAGTIDAVHCWPSGSLLTLRRARELGIPSFLERPNTHTRSAMETVASECDRIGLTLSTSHSHAADLRRLKHEEEEFALADRLLCPSENVAQSFLARGFSESQIARHQYGFDPSHFPLPPARSPDRPCNAVFVGRCEPRKGLHYALRAWIDSGAANHGKFFICGRFVPGYRELLASLLAHPSVQCLGYVADVGAVMRDCDMLLLPSIEEGSALVTYEARASGCVLVVSSETGARCCHNEDSLVHAPGNLAELTAHLKLLMEDRTTLARLRAASLRDLDTITWDAAGARLASLYGEIAGLPRESVAPKTVQSAR